MIIVHLVLYPKGQNNAVLSVLCDQHENFSLAPNGIGRNILGIYPPSFAVHEKILDAPLAMIFIRTLLSLATNFNEK